MARQLFPNSNAPRRQQGNAGDKPSAELSELARQNPDFGGMHRGLVALLKFIEHSHKQNAISDESYYEVKGETLKKLSHIKKFVRKDEFSRLAGEFEHGAEDAAESYDALDSEELVESFMDRIEPRARTSPARQLARISNERRHLVEAKKNVEAMLEVLEEGYNEGSISHTTYAELSRGNSRKLERINELLNETYFAEDSARSPRAVASARRPAAPKARDWQAEKDEFGPEDEAEMPTGQAVEKLGSPEQQLDYVPPRELGQPSISELEYARSSTPLPPQVRIPLKEPSEADEIIARLALRPGSGEQAASFQSAAPELSQAEKAAMGSDSAPAPQSAAPQPSPAAGGLMSRLRNVISHAAPGAVAVQQEAKPMQESASAVAVAQPAAQQPQPAAAAPQPIMLQAEPAASPAEFTSAPGAKTELELEKLKAKVDALSEMRDSLYERISTIMENVGEIRSMVFSVDSAFKQSEAKTEKFIDLVSAVEPQRFMKELEKRDKHAEEISLRAEKLEAITQDVSRDLSSIKSLLESIGSLRNISEVNRDISAKLNRMEGMLGKSERLNEDVSTKFIDINNKIDEFNSYKARQELLVESVKELVTMVESLNSKLADYSTKEDSKNLKKELEGLRNSLRETGAKIVLFQRGRDVPAPVKEIHKKIDGVKLLLSTTEEEFTNHTITDEDYRKIKAGNTQKLYELENELAKRLDELTAEQEKQEVMAARIVQQVGVQTSSGEMPSVQSAGLQPLPAMLSQPPGPASPQISSAAVADSGTAGNAQPSSPPQVASALGKTAAQVSAVRRPRGRPPKNPAKIQAAQIAAQAEPQEPQAEETASPQELLEPALAKLQELKARQQALQSADRVSAFPQSAAAIQQAQLQSPPSGLASSRSPVLATPVIQPSALTQPALPANAAQPASASPQLQIQPVAPAIAVTPPAQPAPQAQLSSATSSSQQQFPQSAVQSSVPSAIQASATPQPAAQPEKPVDRQAAALALIHSLREKYAKPKAAQEEKPSAPGSASAPTQAPQPQTQLASQSALQAPQTPVVPPAQQPAMPVQQTAIQRPPTALEKLSQQATSLSAAKPKPSAAMQSAPAQPAAPVQPAGEHHDVHKIIAGLLDELNEPQPAAAPKRRAAPKDDEGDGEAPPSRMTKLPADARKILSRLRKNLKEPEKLAGAKPRAAKSRPPSAKRAAVAGKLKAKKR